MIYVLECVFVAMMATLPVSLAAQNDAAPATPVHGEWFSIFNGRDLDGWTPKFTGRRLGENYRNTFRASDGRLVVSYDEYESFNGEFGHLFYKTPLSHYRVRFDYRFVGEQVAGGPEWAMRNNGIMLHCPDPKTMRLDQNFPVSVEMQLLGGTGEGERSTGNMCSPGSHVVVGGELIKVHCVNSGSPTYHGDQWVRAEVEVRGNELIRYRIDGDVVFELTAPEYDADDPDGGRHIDAENRAMNNGYIALQAETHPTEFRDIELMLLEPGGP